MKKRTLKLTSLFLAGTMLISMLAGCGKKEEEKQQDTQQWMSPKAQKEKEWMDKVKSNPGQVLRYRLYRQAQEQR